MSSLNFKIRQTPHADIFSGKMFSFDYPQLVDFFVVRQLRRDNENVRGMKM